MANDRIGLWRRKKYRGGAEGVAPDEHGTERRFRVTGIGDDGRIYMERLEAQR